MATYHTTNQNNPRYLVRTSHGSLLIGVLIFAAIGITMVTAFVGWAVTLSHVSRTVVLNAQALEIAEAGIDYYRWHLAHDDDDFKDGTTTSGPYVHTYEDKDGIVLGAFSLTITPPPVGSTKVVIQSTGTVVADPAIERVLRVTLAKPSFAKYAVVANDAMRFGEGTITYGPIHSNGGIRFDGLAYNTVTSALTSYDDPDHATTGGVSVNEYAVHTHLKPPPLTGTYGDTNIANVAAETPPAALATRSDVFVGGRSVGVPAVDFTGITSDLASMKTLAQSSGSYYAASGKQGYHVVLKTSDTYDLYQVKSLQSASCNAPSGSGDTGSSQYGWGSWTIKSSNGQTFLGTYAFPTTGVLFFEDNVWVDGTINGAHLTIAAGSFPDNATTRKSITVNNDLRYTNFNGNDTIGLIAQNNINVGMNSEDDLVIDAALVAQNGRVGRYLYDSGCNPYHERDTLTLYGMIASNKRYGFAYTDGTGYATRTLTYDSNLLYTPPPSFPLTSDSYVTLLWEEL